VDYLSSLSSRTVIGVGIALMIIGVVAILAGIAGAIVTMVKELRHGPSAATEGRLGAIAKIITAVTEFVKTLVTSPVWIALVVLGIVLVGFGWWLSTGGVH
jgi:hypothetical protein